MPEKPIVQVWRKLGLLPNQVTASTERRGPAGSDSCPALGLETRRKPLTAEQWWVETAALLCQKADLSGVVDFRITKAGGKWTFEITPA